MCISRSDTYQLSRVIYTQPETAPTQCSVAASRAFCPHCHLHTVLCHSVNLDACSLQSHLYTVL